MHEWSKDTFPWCVTWLTCGVVIFPKTKLLSLTVMAALSNEAYITCIEIIPTAHSNIVTLLSAMLGLVSDVLVLNPLDGYLICWTCVEPGGILLLTIRTLMRFFSILDFCSSFKTEARRQEIKALPLLLYIMVTAFCLILFCAKIEWVMFYIS